MARLPRNRQVADLATVNFSLFRDPGSSRGTHRMHKKIPAVASQVSRRDFLAAGLATPALGTLASQFLSRMAETQTSDAPPYSPPRIDFRRLVSRANLTYTTPAARSEAGMPVGKGRMGSLIWTTPSSLNFQINR